MVMALLGNDPEAATRAIWKHIDSVMERIIEFEDEEIGGPQNPLPKGRTYRVD